jgi:hypothetical protein
MIGASPHRVANLRRLIASLASEMSRSEIATLFGCSESGARNYIRELQPILILVRRDGVTAHSVGQPVYRITDDVAAVQEFIAALEASVVPPTPRKKPVKVVDATRHVHILADDEAFVPRLHRGLPQRDALVAAFFGEAQP